ncbi:RHS repeat-associated core domain-containing protein [Granulicella mallensis]|uniref:RHS repeat-associated core domain-containing protein n=1 Tax=Granulicella mallensis TaxID=940614 RepID=UPI00167FACC5|nr:RHS repeat-associated core domain-containing protein [Granulicella mallensis]
MASNVVNFKLLALVVVIFGASFKIQAQTINISNETMTPTFGAGHSYIQDLAETVNPANGSVSVRIQLPVPAGRGLTEPFMMRYDSNARGELRADPYVPDPDQGNVPAVQWFQKDVLGINDTAGWSYGYPSVSLEEYQTWCPYNNGYSYQGTDDYIFEDGSGEQHPLRVASVIPTRGCPPPTDYSTNGDTYVYATLGVPAQENVVPPLKVYDSNGTTYSFTQPGGTPAGILLGDQSTASQSSWLSFPDSIEDRNGNIIKSSSTSGSYSFTDTLGRTALSFPKQVPTSLISNLQVGNYNYKLTWASLLSSTAGFNTNPVQDFGQLGASSYSSSAFVDIIHCSTVPTLGSGNIAISSIALPNGDTFQFHYNNWGLLSEIDYPSGEWVKYEWKQSDQPSDVVTFDGIEQIPPGGGGTGIQSVTSILDNGYESAGPTNEGWHYFENACVFKYQNAVIGTRTVGSGTTTTQVQTFTYSTQWDPANSILWKTKSTAVTTQDVLRQTTKTAQYTYTPQNAFTMTGVEVPAQFGGNPSFQVAGVRPSQVPVESSIQYFDWASPTTPLESVTETWDELFHLLNKTTSFNSGPSSSVVTTWTGPGASFLNYPTEVDEYDFGQSAKYRSTQTTYQAFTGGLGGTFYSPCKKQVFDGSGSTTPVSETDFYYDGGSSLCTQGTGQSLASVSSLVSGTHDETLYGTGVSVARGNLTEQVQVLAGGQSPEDTYSYDETGQILSHTAPCGNVTCSDVNAASETTKYTYTGSKFFDTSASGNTNAYVASVTSPPTNGVSHVTTYTYRLSDGQMSESVDENLQPTDFYYNDTMGRLTDIYGPTTNGQRAHTQRAYTDGINPSWQDTNPIGVVTTTQLDGFGRTVEVKNVSSGAIVDTTYDGMGQIWKQSNPYLSATDPTYGLAISAYDGLERKVSATWPDGASHQWKFSQNTVTETDEASNSWQRTSDAFGRLTNVVEPAGSSAAYTYDALNNLASISQYAPTQCINEGGGAKVCSVHFGPNLARTFSYDSLSRLLATQNPETGTISYIYDVNNNLKSKTDARGITTNYNYDALNRLISKTYSDGTASASFGYDETGDWGAAGCGGTGFVQCNTIGRLSSATVPNVTQSIYSYDAMGRMTMKSTCVASLCGSDGIDQFFTYDLAGNPTSYDHGTDVGRNAYYGGHGLSYDSAGRLSLVTGYQQPASPSNLFKATSYGPVGLLESSLGNGLNETRSYDNRMRQTSYNALNAAPTSSPSSLIGNMDTFYNNDVVRFPNLSINGSALPQNGLLTVGGWAGDAQSCPVAAVEIDIDQTPIGYASLGVSRPDVQQIIYGNDGQHANCGYNFTGSIGGVSVGPHTVNAYALDASGNRQILVDGPGNNTITVSADAAPNGTIDGTLPGQITSGGLMTLGGWAIDSQMHAPVGAVKVLIDGVPIGYATLGGARPDVAIFFGDQRYANSGWNFTGSIGNLSVGQHTASVIVYDSGGQSFSPAAVPISVVADTAAVRSNFDVLQNASNQTSVMPLNGTIVAKGWVGEFQNETSCAANISRVDILVDGNYVGQAQTGITRTDVAANLQNQSCLNSGWQFTGQVSNIDPGVHTFTARAYDETGGSTIVTSVGPMTMQINAQLSPASVTNPLPSQYAWSLGYEPNSNVGYAFDSVNGNYAYLYDNLNRLVAAGSSTTGLQWSYDSFGNRTSQVVTAGSGTSSYETFNAKNQPNDVAFDAAGNALGTGVVPLQYDAESRLINANGTRYVYDAEGQRVAKYSGNTLTNVYLYDQAGHVITELDGSFNVIRREVYAGSRHLGTYDQNGNLTYVLSDWLGTERARANSAGTLCETTTSQPFGDNQQSSGTCFPSPTFFTGKERDTESGLDYFGARYYGSNMGRWMSPDYSHDPDPVPYADLSDPQSLNLYGYVGNNPLSQTDDDGHCYGQSQSSIWSCIGGFFHNLFAASNDNSSVTTSQTGFVSVGPVSVNVGGVASGMVTELRNESQDAYGSLRGHQGQGQPPIPLNNDSQRIGAGIIFAGMLAIPDAGEATDAIEIHHLLPRQFASFFERAGLDVEDHTIPLGRTQHRLKPNGVHAQGSDGWNQTWARWIENNGNASKQQILAQLARMRKAFGI